MPSRTDVFENNGIYHIFNKTIDQKNIFGDEKISYYFLELLRYYRSVKILHRYSLFRSLEKQMQDALWKKILDTQYFKTDILSYSLMPNHFHLLLKQKTDKGIVRMMADILNSITRYYNILNNRKGPIFLTQFRSKAISSREQLIHMSRYIHLNHYSAQMVKDLNILERYPFTSLREYLFRPKNKLCNTSVVLNQFKNRVSYRNFVRNNAEYQKTLEFAKHVNRWAK